MAIPTEQSTRRTRAARSWVALLPTVFLSFLFFSRSPASHADVPIAVIVHKEVPVNDLSLSELREIFLGERRFWARDLTITLLTPPRGTREREVLLKKIYQQRSEAQVQHYWVNKLFDDEEEEGDDALAFPKITGSHEMSANLVRTIPGAIALVPANRIPKGVKVLLIDGKKPGEAGYPLHSSD